MFIYPMLLSKGEAFSSKSFIYECKFDGIRLQLVKINGQTKLYTRHKLDISNRFPELLESKIPDNCILDGELVHFDTETNQIDFEKIMERFMTKNPLKRQRIPVQFVVFDILFLEKDLRSTPLMERKKILANCLEDSDLISKIKYIPEHGQALFESIKERDLEGMVAKRIDSTYFSSSPSGSKRSTDWLKVINWKYENVFITGYSKKEFAWICSKLEGETLRPVGLLTLGTTPTVRKAFYHVARTIKTAENQNFVYLQPKIQATVKIRNWTKNGKLRTPVFDSFVI